MAPRVEQAARGTDARIARRQSARPRRGAGLRPYRCRRRPAPPDALANRRHGDRLGRDLHAAGAGGRDHLVVDTAQRPSSAKGPRPAGRGFLHLRVAAERHRRCGGDLRQERQRGHPPRRQGSGPLEPGDRRSVGRHRRRGGAAGRRRAACRHHRSGRRGRTAPHARVDQRRHPPRRREPHPPRERRGPHAGHQTLRRQLPCLHRPRGRSRNGRPPDGQLEVPAAGRVQRGRVALGACRRGRVAAAAPSARP